MDGWGAGFLAPDWETGGNQCLPSSSELSGSELSPDPPLTNPRPLWSTPGYSCSYTGFPVPPPNGLGLPVHIPAVTQVMAVWRPELACSQARHDSHVAMRRRRRTCLQICGGQVPCDNVCLSLPYPVAAMWWRRYAGLHSRLFREAAFVCAPAVCQHSNMAHLLNPSVGIWWAQTSLFPCLPRQRHCVTLRGYLFACLANAGWRALQD